MSLLPDDGNSRSKTWLSRLSRVANGGDQPARDPSVVIPPEGRKAAMSTLDPLEYRWSFRALVLGTIAGIALPLYIVSQNRVTKNGKNSIAVAPDAWLVMAAILLFCVIGFLALWKRKRTLVAFSFFLIGFGATVFIGLIGFAFIAFGGWLMLRAWRMNRYGTTNAKAVAREAAVRPRGKERKDKVSAKSPAPGPASRKPPTASKRYTPKAPPRKKIPKPTE
jgi:hypothetical protein